MDINSDGSKKERLCSIHTVGLHGKTKPVKRGGVMILEVGEKIHVMIRRRFENDLRRHFVGEITEVGENVVRVEGYTFVLDTVTKQYTRRPELRTRIISLTDSGNIINVIPAATKLEAVTYKMSEDNRLIVTDGEHLSLDVNEFGVRF